MLKLITRKRKKYAENPDTGNDKDYRFLVVTRNLPPLIGGMERLMWHVLYELKPLGDVAVVGPQGSSQHLMDEMSVSEVRARPAPLFLSAALFAAFLQAIIARPTTVIAGSGLTAPIVWFIGRVFGCRVWVYLHGLDVSPKSRAYRAFWLPILRRCDRFLANSHFTMELAANEGVPRDRITVLNPGVAIPSPGEITDDSYLRMQLNLPANTRIVLFVGRLTQRKGLQQLLHSIYPKIRRELPDVRLLVIGPEPVDALQHSTPSTPLVANPNAHTDDKSGVLFFGAATEEELLQAYSSADVLAFPLQHVPYDYEGFGMVALEAAAYGCPTVAFDVGGVSDAVVPPDTGSLIPPGDDDSFAKAVVAHINDSNPGKRRRCRQFTETRSWSVFGQKLRALLRKSEENDTPND